jgi:hypothetical protein
MAVPPASTSCHPQHDILVVEVQKEESLQQPAKRMRLHIPHCLAVAMSSMAQHSSSSSQHNEARVLGSADSSNPSSSTAAAGSKPRRWQAVLKYIINGRYVPTSKELVTVSSAVLRNNGNVSMRGVVCSRI